MADSAQQVIHELTQAGLLSSDEVTKFDAEIRVGVDALLNRLVQDGRITQYQANKFKAGDASDIHFGEYLVLEELGRGGMGTVLLAKHRRMDREVAIKILPITILESKAAVARFYQEVKVAAQLSHPNVVHAYDAGEHHGFHYLVMEYVRGHDLARVLEQLGPLPTSLALDYVSQAAAGLEYAHRKGVVHRDIKPANLLLDDEGTVKVLDMGLARLGGMVGGERSLHLTTTGQVMGTVEYMSPEQAEDTRTADHRSDIYSLGCTLYRLLTGESPFARDTVVKTILAHRDAPIPWIECEKEPDRLAVNPIFQRMVAKSPADRYQSVTALMSDIQPILEGNSGATSPQPPSRSVPSDPTDLISAELLRASPSSGEPTQPVHPELVFVKPHRAKLLLIMGIGSICTVPFCIGFMLGIVTWLCARSDLKEMSLGSMDPSGNKLTYLSQTLGGASVALFLIGLILWPIAVAFGL